MYRSNTNEQQGSSQRLSSQVTHAWRTLYMSCHNSHVSCVADTSSRPSATAASLEGHKHPRTMPGVEENGLLAVDDDIVPKRTNAHYSPRPQTPQFRLVSFSTVVCDCFWATCRLFLGTGSHDMVHKSLAEASQEVLMYGLASTDESQGRSPGPLVEALRARLPRGG